MNKKGYKINLRTLQLYMELGLEVSAVYRVLEYKQEPWLAPYIAHNTELRKNAKTDFHKDLYKLKNNAIYGKSMENVHQYQRIELVNRVERYQKLAKDPLFIKSSIFSKELIAVHRYQHTVCLDKPIFVGAAILDISKELIYRFHYEHMLPKYGLERCHLLFTDTGEFFINIKIVLV